MHSILQTLIRFVVRHLLTFCLVVVVLLIGNWAIAEFKAFRSVKSDLATLEVGAKQVDTHSAALATDVTTRMNSFQSASIERLDARIGAISQSIQAKSRIPRVSILSFPLPKGSALAYAAVTHARLAVEIELLTQERDYLTQLRATVDAGLNHQAAYAKLEQLRLEHVKAYQALQANKRLLDQLKQESPVKARLPGTFEHRKFAALASADKKLRIENALIHQAFLAQKKVAGRAAALGRPAAFMLNQTRLDLARKPLHDSIAQGQDFSSQNWFNKASGPVMAVVPIAALLVLSMLLVPIIVKLLFYFVLAPVAAKLPAIFVDRHACGAVDMPAGAGQFGMDAPRISSVSQSVTIGQDDVLLIHAEFIQSLPISGKKDTKWLMDWSCPFTSMAAGLVAMTRIRAEQAESVVISSTADALSEIAILRLPQDSAMVFQPRGLIGVIYSKKHPLTITRHWRLGSLHAWLTLQLRYLVFRGPVTLIVKGCRGVRLEAAGSGRSISQSATLGFSANLAYSTIRSETFFPYLTGKHALFHDRFEGSSGFYAYEETPQAGKKPGLAGRGLTGFFDAILKVFGI